MRESVLEVVGEMSGVSGARSLVVDEFIRIDRLKLKPNR